MKWSEKVIFYRRAFTGKRICNALSAISSFYLSKFLRKNIRWGLPISYFVEPTNLCNLRCIECPVGLKQLSRVQGHMNLDLFKNIVDQISPHAFHLLLYFQGESFIHPEITRMINYASEKKLLIEISTNGTRLANPDFTRKLLRSGLWRLVVSLDGASEATYRVYRQKGLFNRVLKGIRQAVEIKTEMGLTFPEIIIQFLVMRHNEHEMEDIKKLGRELGVNRVIFKSPQIYDFENAEDILPQNEHFRRYVRENGRYRLKGSFSGYCQKLWIGSVITQNGLVLPCCFDKDANFVLGDLFNESLHQIHQNSATQRFREKVILQRDQLAICQNCSEGLKTFFK